VCIIRENTDILEPIANIPEKYNLSGQRFGRWTVLPECHRGTKGARIWKCRCDCGTERLILARSLKSGKTKSCGCLNREIVRNMAEDLTGQTFGKLTVLERDDPGAHRGSYWRCRCNACGGECVVDRHRLVKGIKTHCGCKNKNDHTKKNITGQKFRMLTALYETDKRDRNGSVVWHCRCDCGNEVDISYDTLVYSEVVSCGCRRLEANKELSGYVTRAANTSVDMLRRKNKVAHSTTGIIGVYQQKNGRFRAEINFQNKNYRLGTYQTVEAATKARLRAEQVLHEDFLEFYDAWRKQADLDPDWAAENPVSVKVKQLTDSSFDVKMQPELLIHSK